MRQLVGVHGVGNFRAGETAADAAERLTKAWRTYLARGALDQRVDEFEVSVAYYAGHLAPKGAQGTDDVPLEHLDPAVEELVRAWIDEFDLPDEQAQGLGTWPLRQAIGWIAERRRLAPDLVEKFVSRFFPEVAAYLPPAEAASKARNAARAAVEQEIRERRPHVVVAHSLGSVVAYEALWAQPDIEIDLLVTLGSPLALPHAVFPRLAPPARDELGQKPPSVRRWVNIADPGDLVAIPAGGISRRFRLVDLDVGDAIHAFDFHLAANYLACRKLADVLAESLSDGT
ncbi:serine peptidase [Streptomyces sp. NPDC101151]|uniref:serine peptidase n=1 Tax=Streptomyces sp. NPDC101151 TaxID=3366115 RepID=UPI0038206BE8